MLRLRYRTPKEWAKVALKDMDALLLDHRFCEGRAAASARAFVKRYGWKFPSLVGPMEELAREEDEHLAMCERLLKERGVPHLSHHGNPYITALRDRVNVRGPGSELDQLLLAAMIEARSAERFRLLADELGSGPMGGFYSDLFAAEARHHVFFATLALEIFGEPAEEGLERVAEIEGRIAAARPWGSFLH